MRSRALARFARILGRPPEPSRRDCTRVPAGQVAAAKNADEGVRKKKPQTERVDGGPSRLRGNRPRRLSNCEGWVTATGFSISFFSRFSRSKTVVGADAFYGWRAPRCDIVPTKYARSLSDDRLINLPTITTSVRQSSRRGSFGPESPDAGVRNASDLLAFGRERANGPRARRVFFGRIRYGGAHWPRERKRCRRYFLRRPHHPLNTPRNDSEPILSLYERGYLVRLVISYLK